MLLVALNARTASGISVENAEKHAARMEPTNGDIRITQVQQTDGAYVVIFTDHSRGYAFGTWLTEHIVKNKVVVVGDDNELAEALVELLPDLAKELAAKAGGPRDSAAQLKREETIQLLVKALIERGRSPFFR